MNPPKKIKVILASPRDVDSERNKVREVILNTINLWAKFANIEFIPIDWKHNTYPSSGDYTQQVVTNQFGENYEALIAIFWHKVGTPTPFHHSGTVEEIETALKRSSEDNSVNVMLYFKTKEPPKLEFDESQFNLLKTLKSEWSKRGVYYWDFKKSSELIELLVRHLSLYVEQKYFIDENTNKRTKDYLINQSQKQSTVVEYMELFNKDTLLSNKIIRGISELINEHTSNQLNESSNLRNLLKLKPSSEIRKMIDKELKKADNRTRKYSEEFLILTLELKELFVKRFHTYSAALLKASTSGRGERRMMRKISKILPEQIDSFEHLLIAINECIDTSQAFVNQWSHSKFGETEGKVLKSYNLHKETIKDFIRILNETKLQSKKLLARRIF